MTWKSVFIVPPANLPEFLFDEQKKLCEQCKYCSIKVAKFHYGAQWNCSIRGTEKGNSCSLMRQPGKQCGPEGKLFVPKA